MYRSQVASYTLIYILAFCWYKEIQFYYTRDEVKYRKFYTECVDRYDPEFYQTYSDSEDSDSEDSDFEDSDSEDSDFEDSFDDSDSEDD